MKNLTILSIAVISCLSLVACDSKKPKTEDVEKQTAPVITEEKNVTVTDDKLTAGIDWQQVPELENIGDFPFITAPDGIDVYDLPIDDKPKDGITDLFEFKKFEVYNGKSVFSVEGKLAVLFFVEDTSNGFKYDQYIFDRNISQYLQQIGAKQLYQGKMPDNEQIKEKLKENQFTGKYHTLGLLDDSPFAVYAFKNNGKKYIVNIQSNSAQGTIFVMELKGFEPTMTAYKASDIQKELDQYGKAILYINFDTNKASLKADGQQVIDEIKKLLNSDPTLKLSIEGHTDNTGNAANNKVLSQHRAETVYQLLLKEGISKDRLQAKGFGSDRQLVDNSSEENKAKNRRVELVKF